MSARSILFILCAFFSITSLFAQKPDGFVRVPSAFENQWEAFETAGLNGMPNQQLEILDKVIEQSLQQKNAPELYRALHQYARAILESLKDPEEKYRILERFEAMPAQLEAPFSNIVHGFLFEQFHVGYQSWDIRSWRNDFEVACIVDGKVVKYARNYDTQQIIKSYHLRKSLESPELLFAQKSFDYANSLYITDSVFFLKSPSLFDLLADQALRFFTDNDRRMRATAADPQWYAASEDFLKNTSSETLKIFQQLELHHWKMKNFNAYTYRALQRLDYVLQISKRNQQDNKKFLEALRILKTRLAGSDAILGVICREEQEKLNDPANRYQWDVNPGTKDKAGEVHATLSAAIQQFPNSAWLADAKNLIRNIESKNINIRFQQKQMAGKPTLMTVDYQNVSEAYLTVYHVDRHVNIEGYGEELFNPNKHKVHTQKLVLDQNGKFNNHSKDFIIPAFKQTGEYVFLITTTADSADVVTKLKDLDDKMNIAYATVEIHEFSVIRNSSSSNIKVAVLNQQSGNPVAGASVYGYEGVNKDVFRFLGKTNSAGEFNSDMIEDATLKIVYGKDSVTQYIYPYNYYEEDYNPVSYRYITDRSIYRPGQTVHFKIYAFEGKSPDYKVMAKHESEVAFTDYQGVMLSSVTGYTNEFGTFAGSFTLPRSGMTGGISLSVNDTYVGNITVEEYKRPSFEIEAKYDKPGYKLGEKVTVSGKVKAYAGYGLSDSKVHVRISSSYGYRYYYGGEDEQLLDTVITSNALGEFSISFIARTKNNDGFGASFTYDISATSIAGETQNTSNSIFIGKERSEWEVNIPVQVFSDETAYGKIAVSNGDQDKSLPKKIEVELVRKNPKNVPADLVFMRNEFQSFDAAEFKKQFKNASYYGDIYETPEYIAVSAFTMQSGDSLNLNQLVKNMAGSYQLRLRCIDGTDTMSMVSNFNYIRTDTKKNQHVESLWMVASTKHFKPGDEVSAYLGSKYKKQNVLVEIYRGSQLVRHEWIKVKGRKKITYKIQPEDLGGINIHAFTLRDGIAYEASVSVYVPFDSKKLDVKLETVREILRPGANEKWIVSVSTPDGSPLSSELAAGMADASLDQFVNNPWNLSLYEDNYSYPHWEMDQGEGANFRTLGAWSSNGDYLYYLGDATTSTYQFNMDGIPPMEGKAVASFSVSANAMGATSAVTQSVTRGGTWKDVGGYLLPQDPAPEKVRSNFNETAFFYPQLTAKDNRFQFEFTLPDALTRWKFQALAHDKLMRFGYRMDQFVAQKELMVDPNEPRFFRAGDEYVLAVDLVNLTEKEQNVTATLEWFDPYTNIVIPNILGAMPEQQAKLPAKGMQTVNWTLKIPKTGLDLIAYRVKVSSGQFSDAEEKVIPVLSNRTQVIESVPVTVEGKGSFTFELPKLLQQTSPTQHNEKLVLEYNANPLWSAVMAIPYITDYPYDCAEQVFSKFFANMISLVIVQQNPLIQKVLSQPGTSTPDQFLSALQTNEDLKAIVLAETPWVLEAKNEAEQKRRITALFETNNLMQQASTNLNKLTEMQNADGGWSWFAGGNSNVYITQHILSGFGHMRSLGLNYEDFEGLDKAVNFLESHYQKQYKQLKKEQVQKLEGLSSLEIQWLYSREMLGLDTSAVSDYYAKCLTRDWLKFPLHVQAMSGVYFLHAGQPEMAQKIYKSIQSKATTRKNLGTYWNENKNAYYWDRNAIETQASLIEFFKKSGADEKTLASMKLWLLNQKRGQYWESTKTTAWACYALLIDAKPLLKDNLTEKVSIGNQEVGGDAVAGYLRKTYSGGEIQPSMGRMTVEQTAEEPGFGSLNLVYTEEIEKLTKNTAGMQLEKQLFVVRDGKEIPVTPTTKLALGDLIRVHLQITSDRNLEFVHVKDLRASGMENVETLSAYRSSGNLYYYNTNRDASTEFFLDNLPKGKHTITYDLRISGRGAQSTGYALVECLYAPEFRANSAAGTIRVE